MGTIHQVPKKLEQGMKVVVWIKPEVLIPFRGWTTLKCSKWHKATLVRESVICDYYKVIIDDYPILLERDECIIIRSVASKDNQTLKSQATMQRSKLKCAERRKAAKEIK